MIVFTYYKVELHSSLIYVQKPCAELLSQQKVTQLDREGETGYSMCASVYMHDIATYTPFSSRNKSLNSIDL